ncbi:hypothetical protein Pmar_PMAR023062 [Perkinsus marinus ATCC 50983]|uniref:Septin-type G domain-containing protein n=1 Tax=Perkinsus marinus (strain ATCC 50983 / TXsc) TaxID=423536 RepID=C5LGN2_PERM5|nr:hypothetical protein Pmar_PMAR023062 [Perkinsus marinus ATCC 50983]EER04077.1 hypothetical protein Pmar_PMAR023062 [Perkinsus marinus ATCC 50983]|eukprot:XP_002772261.1 hypothetical protein Pmar_PMAR023062 [Perkinsus marinus ATCC 50983]
MFSYFFGITREEDVPAIGVDAENEEEEKSSEVHIVSSEKASPSFHPGDVHPGVVENTSPVLEADPPGEQVGRAPSHQSTYDDLSSLSTIISRDLRLADDASSDAAAASVLQKLEKQNKWRFRASGCRLNILLVGKSGVGKTTLRENMMRSWVEVGGRQSLLGSQKIYQVTDKPAAFSFQVTITESSDVSPQLVRNLEMEMLAYRDRRKRARLSSRCHQKPPSVGVWDRPRSVTDDRIHVCLFLVRAAPVGGIDLPLAVMQGIGKLTNLTGTDLDRALPHAWTLSRVKTLMGALSKGGRLLHREGRAKTTGVSREIQRKAMRAAACPLLGQSRGIHYSLQEQRGKLHRLDRGGVVPNDEKQQQQQQGEEFQAYIYPEQGNGDVVAEIVGHTESSSREVLQCPLLLDLASTEDEQDSRYPLPRFDGHPSRSAEFLRMVIIESCSLLLIDRARLLFNKFYLKMEKRRHESRVSSQMSHAVMSGVVVASAAAMFLLSSSKNSGHAS